MFKRVITMITAIALAIGLFTACTPETGNGAANASGKVYDLASFDGNTGEGMLPPVVNSKGELTVASQTDGAPVKIATYDAAGKKTGEVTTDVTEPATNFTLDGKDQAYILTASDQNKETVNVLDASGKTVNKIPVGDILKNLPTMGGKSFSEDLKDEAENTAEPGEEATGSVNGNQEEVPQTQGQQANGPQSTGQPEGLQTQQGEGPQTQEQQAARPQAKGNKMQLSGAMISGFTASSDGNVFLSVMGAGVMQIDNTGKLVRTYNTGMMNYISMNEKEQLLVYSMGQGPSNITAYDTKSGSEAAKVEAPLSNPSMIFYDKAGKKLFYLNGNGVYPVKEDGKSGDLIAKLTDFSLDSSTRALTGFSMDHAGSIYISTSDSNSSRGMMVGGSKNGAAISMSATAEKADRIDKLALVDASSVQQKKVLTIAGISTNSMLNTAIAAFQKAHPDYKVDVKTYETEIVGMKQSGQEIDLGSMIQQFNTDIISGNGADIYILDDLPYYKYIDKGILADLGQMMESAGMDTTEYFGNIFDACKVNGKLYTIPIAFEYNVMAGKASNMPSSATPTVDEFLQKAKALPSGLAAFPKEDAVDAFADFMEDNYSYYVDQSAHTARFNSPEFIKVLNDFKALADTKMSAVDNEEQDPYEQIGENKLAFAPVSLGRAEELSMVKAMAGEETVFSKMPAMEQETYNFNARGLFGINASSQNKEEALDFIKIMLSQDIQSNMQFDGFPVNKAANASAIERLKGNGTMGKEKTRLVIRTKNKEYEAKPLTDAEYAAIASTFEKLNRLSAPDPNIVKILQEELPAFFSGQKSAEDVASLIQNRVSTILSE